MPYVSEHAWRDAEQSMLGFLVMQVSLLGKDTDLLPYLLTRSASSAPHLPDTRQADTVTQFQLCMRRQIFQEGQKPTPGVAKYFIIRPHI